MPAIKIMYRAFYDEISELNLTKSYIDQSLYCPHIGMDRANSIKTGVIALAVVAGILLVIPSQQPVQAAAFQDGQNQAEQDFISSNGQDKNTSCSPEYGVDYCTAYKLGYESRWAHMSITFDCSSGECR